MISRIELTSWIEANGSSSLKNIRNRKQFAQRLANYINYWNVGEISTFVEEMRGLDFHRSEDRVIFCDLFFSWIPEAINESFNS